MKLIRHYDAFPQEFTGPVVAIGNFDGLHKGHQSVIAEAGAIARADKKPWAVLTFEPHPRRLFSPDAPPFLLTPLPLKRRLIEELGVDMLIVQSFDHEFARKSAESFICDFLVGDLKAHHVVAGYDFVFGRKRGGNCDLLLRLGKEMGYGFTVIGAMQDQAGNTYSSSRIREYLKSGDVEQANRILGRPFEITGTVEKGEGRGQDIGFPTANISIEEQIHPRSGVYAVEVSMAPWVQDSRWLPGVANFGFRPTFGQSKKLFEVHLLSFCDNLYGKCLKIRLISFLRSEQKFADITSLKTQIVKDIACARRVLAPEATGER